MPANATQPRPSTLEDPQLEFVTTVRGRVVSCWLEERTLRGDDELLRRLRRFATRPPEGDLELSHLLTSAVGSEVTIRCRPTGSVSG